MKRNKKIKLLTSMLGSGVLLASTPVVMTACSNEQTYDCTMEGMKWTKNTTTPTAATPSTDGTYTLYEYTIKLDGEEIANQSNSYAALKKAFIIDGNDSKLRLKTTQLSNKSQTISITPTQAGDYTLKLKAKFASGWTGIFSIVLTVA